MLRHARLRSVHWSLLEIAERLAKLGQVSHKYLVSLACIIRLLGVQCILDTHRVCPLSVCVCLPSSLWCPAVGSRTQLTYRQLAIVHDCLWSSAMHDLAKYHHSAVDLLFCFTFSER